MITTPPLASAYDAIVIGARPAGAGTALLLARLGLRVLVIDRGQYGTDTLSTHALMRAGVLQLSRWGVLPRIIAAGTPAVRSATFIYGNETLRVPIKPRDGVEALYAPRRTVLDREIAYVAMDAGVTFSYGTVLVDLLRNSQERVCGIVARRESGETVSIRAAIVVGADGLRSKLARLVDTCVTRQGAGAAANVFGYWSGVPADGYRWYFREGLSAGAIPTNDGLTCIFASVPSHRFAEVFRDDLYRGYLSVLAVVAPDIALAMRGEARVGTLRGWSGQPGFLRRATGPGWALVGDAAYFKDPLTAHGITDALVEAEYLARAIATGRDAALAAYALDRDRRASELFAITDRIASFEWTLDEARALHMQLASAMSDEVTALGAFTGEATFA